MDRCQKELEEFFSLRKTAIRERKPVKLRSHNIIKETSSIHKDNCLGRQKQRSAIHWREYGLKSDVCPAEQAATKWGRKAKTTRGGESKRSQFGQLRRTVQKKKKPSKWNKLLEGEPYFKGQLKHLNNSGFRGEFTKKPLR